MKRYFKPNNEYKKVDDATEINGKGQEYSTEAENTEAEKKDKSNNN
jgi:hypothetical protein